MPAALSEAELQSRLNETRLCQFSDCGKYFPVYRWRRLRRCWYKSKSKYCSRSCSNRDSIDLDIPGKRYGRWTVVSSNYGNRTSEPHALCRCDCGTERIVSIESLRVGNSSSCGCSKKKITLEIKALRLKETVPCFNCGVPVSIWRRCRARRKIMEEHNFCSGSCSALHYQSQRTFLGITSTTRSKKEYLAFGESKSLTEWTNDSRCVVTYYTLRDRVGKGWSVEQSVTTPLKKTKFVSRIQSESLMQDVVSGLAALAS